MRVLGEEWLTRWAMRIEAATARALRDILSTYPFQPGVHKVGPPSTAAELVTLRERMPWVPQDLAALYRHVGPMSLPDITNGYFVHPPGRLIANLSHAHAAADRIGEPLAEDVRVVVFGSNGGGDLYAVTATDGGGVYRLQDAGYEAGVYRGTERGITLVGEDLHDFLEGLLAAVEAFANDGASPISDRARGRHRGRSPRQALRSASASAALRAAHLADGDVCRGTAACRVSRTCQP